MERKTDNKVVLITQKTRLEDLLYRYNTTDQAKFYIEHHGGDFSDYTAEHCVYRECVSNAVAFLESYARLQIVDKEYISSYIFGEKDLIVVIGRDGLVANVLKYLTSQKLIGINPDKTRWDGALLPFSVNDLPKIVPEVLSGKRGIKEITFALASLNDGQTLYGVNDIFIGQRTHTSAKYTIHFNDVCEFQSSSGIIISTGFGCTGWLKSILAGASGINSFFNDTRRAVLPQDFGWSSEYLYFTVREPYPSRSTGSEICFGKIDRNKTLQVESFMPENGVIFSDGIEQDYLQFNSGLTATISVSEKKGKLVV